MSNEMERDAPVFVPESYPRPTLLEKLREKFPDEMERFDKAPWDFRIYAPSMDDAAELHVSLFIGTDKAERCIKLVLPL